MNNKSVNSDKLYLMHHRKIILADGRYMIFYTFDKLLSNASANSKKNPPKIDLETTEEKNV